jgi:hypothetical protein
MSIRVGNPPIVKDGLVVHLDPANPKNYVLSEVEVLVVAGGGGGSYNVYDDGAGGGGGGVLYSSSYRVTPGTSVSVNVGNGGNAGNSIGNKGQNSYFGDLIAEGGGSGMGHRASQSSSGDGGSGGGSGGQYSGTDNNRPGNGQPGQGHRGGHSTAYGGGGGGGAGSPGLGCRSSQVGGNGGDGLAFDISGKLRYYGGGGGGYPKTNYNGLGGKGGGGDTYVAGTPNTGGGGGGGKAGSATLPIAGNGGSGIVIVRYPGPQKATGGNTIENINGFTIHTFTSSGTFTPLSAPTNSGTVYGLQDLTGNGNNATGTNTSYSVNNQGNINFNGTSSGLQLPHNSYWVLEPSTKYSVSVWFYAESAIATGVGMIWSHQRCSNPGLQLYMGSTGTVNWRRSGNTDTIINDGIDYRLQWINAVGTFDGVENMKLYVNSNLVATGTNSAGWTSYFAGYSEVWIGKRYPCGLTDNFNGKIGSFSFYKDKELSQAEVTQNYNATKGRYGY